MKNSIRAGLRVARYFAIVVGGAVSLSGCLSEREAANIEYRNNHPTIEKVGVFDGCEVKYVGRAFADNSFYIARCGATTTTTRQDADTVPASIVAGTTDEQRAAIAEIVKGFKK